MKWLSYLTGGGGADGPGERGGARRRAEEARGGGGPGGRAGGTLRPARLSWRRSTRVTRRGPGGLSLKDWRAGGEAHQSGGGCCGAKAPRPARRRGAGVSWVSSGGARRLAPSEVSHAANKSGIPGGVTASLGEPQVDGDEAPIEVHCSPKPMPETVIPETQLEQPSAPGGSSQARRNPQRRRLSWSARI